MVSKLKIDQRKVKGIMFCGAHRLGKKKRSGNSKPRPIIVRFTCRADRDATWRQRFNLKESSIRMAEDLPQNVREIRRKVLVPALKKARKREGTKATIIGDRLVVNGKNGISVHVVYCFNVFFRCYNAKFLTRISINEGKIMTRLSFVRIKPSELDAFPHLHTNSVNCKKKHNV